MPWNVKRTAESLDREILKSAAGLDDIKSLVLDSTTVDADANGRYIVKAGEVLADAGSNKVKPVSMNALGGSGGGGAYVAADIVAVLGYTVELFIAADVTAGDATDEPVPGLHHGCHFDSSKLLGYTGNETAVEDALKTCIFS